MFRLDEIRAWLLSKAQQETLGPKLKSILKRTESPVGFAVLAGAGLCLLGLYHLSGDDPALREADLIAGSEQHGASDSLIDRAPAEAADAPVMNEAGIDEPAPAPSATERVFKLRRNETLIGLLKRAGMDSRDAHGLVHELKDVTNLRRLQRGQEIKLVKASDEAGYSSLKLRDQFGSEAVALKTDQGFTAERHDIPTIGLTHLVEGEITDSLYMSAQRAGLPTPVIVELIRLMSFDVDFEREIRVGDKFQVYFERTYAPDFEDLDEGRILQVRLELQKRTLEANYYVDDAGKGDYFDEKGQSTRKALMKTPLDVTVVTSTYGRRRHPVLGYTRMHKGVDFRARTGTPIMAAGDGVIERASRYGAYGNYIRIRHNSTYQTAYAHLSKYGRGIKKGTRVKQGQIIGYAGATGRVTAAHLHYEVLVNGKQANPLRLKLPTGRTLKGENLTAFISQRTNLMADIDVLHLQQEIMAGRSLPTVQSAENASISETAPSLAGDR